MLKAKQLTNKANVDNGVSKLRTETYIVGGDAGYTINNIIKTRNEIYIYFSKFTIFENTAMLFNRKS